MIKFRKAVIESSIPFVGLFLVSISVAWSAEPPINSSKDEWFRCETAAQCVIVKGNCDVEWAVNKKFIGSSRTKPPRPDGPCNKPLEFHPPNTFAMCVEGQCQLYPPGNYIGGKQIGDDVCVISSCWGHAGCNYLNCTRKDGSNYTEYAQ